MKASGTDPAYHHAPPTRSSAGRAAFGGLVMLLGLFAAAPVAAELGGSPTTLEADRSHFAAAMKSASAATHSLHTLTLPNGSIVHEYMDGDGVVFAVSWQGPSRPDLRQLLGASFDAFQTAVTPTRPGRLRRPLLVQQGDLVVHSAGHPGAFRGYAYLPQRLPAGFFSDAF